MKFLPVVLTTALLAGCGTINQMSYGSWLEHVGERKSAKYPLTPEETATMQARAAELRARADGLRLNLAAEKERTQRIAIYGQLEDVDDELRPIERQLRERGTNSRRVPPPADYVQGGGV